MMNKEEEDLKYLEDAHRAETSLTLQWVSTAFVNIPKILQAQNRAARLRGLLSTVSVLCKPKSLSNQRSYVSSRLATSGDLSVVVIILKSPFAYRISMS